MSGQDSAAFLQVPCATWDTRECPKRVQGNRSGRVAAFRSSSWKPEGYASLLRKMLISYF